MKKSIIAAAVVASFTTLPTVAVEQSAQDEQEHILVTANRSQQDSFLALSSNVVITNYEIEAMQVTSVGDILKTVAGISVVNQGDSGQMTSIFTRGTNSNHTLVIIDGVRVNSATTGATNLSAISVQQIDRIEVVKGPRAALWGSDAIGGVIQIFTKQYQQGAGNIAAGFGSHGFYQAGGSLGFGNDQHRFTVNVSTEKSGGFNAYTSDPNDPDDIDEPDEDGYQRESLSLVGRSALTDQLSLNLVGRYEQTYSEYDSAYGGYPGVNEQNSHNYHLKAESVYLGEDFSINFALAKSQDQGERFGSGVDENDAQALTTKRDQASLFGQFQPLTNTSFSAGFDWYDEQVSANYDLSSWTEGVQQYGQASRDVRAVFAQINHQQDGLLFESAVRYDDIESVGHKSTYNLSMGYQVADNWLVSVNRGTGFKAPTFNSLYWPGSGNPLLAPEHSLTHELLIRNQGQDYRVELSLYDTEVDDLIAWNSQAGRSENIQEAQMTGADINFSMSSGSFEHQLALAYVDAENVTTQTRLARRPEFSGSYSLNYHLNQWQLGSIISYRGTSEESVWGVGNVNLAAYWLVDFTAAYQVTDKLTINAKLANIFDEKYQTALNYIADGASYRLSMTYGF
ncbi:TonB-dependent receptor domain-containing protein [Thalassotalea ganghwensis]